MTIFYSSVSNVKKWSAALAFLLLMGVQLSWAQTTALTPYPLREGTYQEAFTAIATWGSNFSTGTGANRFGVAYPDPVYPNTNTVFSTGSTGGVQKGTAAIVLLSTGSDGEKPAAFDLHLDFSGTAAGTISLDWAEVNNSTGNRQSTFKLQTNTGPNGLFIDLPQTATVLTNNQAASGKLTVALPAAFNNNAQAKVRFYMSASAGGIAPSGSRPKISIDNLQVTAATSESPATTTITTGAVATTSFCVTTTAGSPEFAVPYTGSGSFTGTYKVQLSDAAGVFTATTTTNIIGTGSSSPITAVIPAGTASGSKYRVRVLNDAPATYGTDNGTDLTVSLAAATNTVTVSPTLAQTVPTTGTGATLQASTAATSTFTWKYATSPTGPYAAIAGATTNSYQLQGSDFPTAGTYYVVAEATTTSACASATGVSEPITVTVSAPISVPALTVSATSLPSFGNIALGEGAPLKSFTVGGTNLSDNITITPPTGFEIRTGNTPFACCAIVLQPVNGEVPTTVIDVRFTPTAVQASEATIPVTSTGLPAAAVAVSGTGVEPMYPASLSTTTLSGLTPTTATTGGTVDTDGGSAVTARGVVWSRTANPLLGTTKTSDGTGTGTFASTITGLLPGTTYYVRAYATNATSTAYGEELSFTTVEVPLATQPTSPASLTATQVTGTSLQLNLTGGDGAKRLVVARLGSAVDAEPVNATTYLADAAFGKGSVLGKGNYVVYNGTGDTLTVTNLRPNTPYYFTVFAFNDNNTPYAENYLTTTPGTLTQTTTPVPTALLLEENFDYAAGSLLTATNWTAHSGAGTKPVAVTATGLSYPATAQTAATPPPW
ncbi:hypothetical protein [Hymenobacter sp. AT01-02]|uniref:hypothetical protein n=1 Tax=Hymenobacter sp. AT01-02 TaxID=1571877 RepID=UPI0006E248ED|nr:hypothetical protein [Hymenobacter sp. AT01-02]